MARSSLQQRSDGDSSDPCTAPASQAHLENLRPWPAVLLLVQVLMARSEMLFTPYRVVAARAWSEMNV